MPVKPCGESLPGDGWRVLVCADKCLDHGPGRSGGAVRRKERKSPREASQLCVSGSADALEPGKQCTEEAVRNFSTKEEAKMQWDNSRGSEALEDVKLQGTYFDKLSFLFV